MDAKHRLPSRRKFLGQSAVAGMLSGLVDQSFLATLNPVSAAEAQADPEIVRFTPETEPLVRLIEETPREQLLEVVGRRVVQGLSYRELLAALFLAGIRNVKPRPDVGHKFHGVMVVNAAHLASLASPAEHRWLPIFWALDYFKATQADQIKAGPWKMAPVKESDLMPASKARQAFIDGMDRWDEAATDVAVTSLVRSAGAQDIFELFFRYGARDFHDWHHAIYTANCRRLLDCIGWRHAEPVLRSLAYTLLNRDTIGSDGDVASERPWRTNQERLAKLRPDWLDGRLDPAATSDLLAALRQGSADEVAEHVVALSLAGVGPQSIWDAIFVRSVELLLCQRGFVALHSVTTMNALHFAWSQAGDDQTRRLILLQAASFLALFRAEMNTDRNVRRGGKVLDANLETLEAVPINGTENDQVAEILTDASSNRQLAARKALAFANQHPQPTKLVSAGRAMVFFKGNEPHDYKFSEAVFEDYRHVSPTWRNRFIAGSVYWLRGAGGPDTPLVERTRAALKA